MKLFQIDDKKTAIINIFIDPERGFLDASLTDKDGGVLYVPSGEEVTSIMGDMIKGSQNTIFILANDYHPRTHISFMVNHSGVMDDRVKKFKALLLENGQTEPETGKELYKQAQQPVHFFDGSDNPPTAFAFPEIVLDEEGYIFGLKEADGRIRKVLVETSSGQPPEEHDRGRVTKVLETYHEKSFDSLIADGALLNTQTLWTMHGVQGTLSCLYPEDMNIPQGLQDKMEGDLVSAVLRHDDAKTNNKFWVVRKGLNSEVDSYGIGIENDRETLTEAYKVFQKIAKELKKLGCEQVKINIGGLAANFCVEFSVNNTDDMLAGFLKMAGMDVEIKYVPEISRGIPIPGGADVPFSLDGIEGRLAKRGIGTATVQSIMNTQNKTIQNANNAFKKSLPKQGR